MEPSQELKEFSIANSPQVTNNRNVTPEGEAAAARIAANRASKAAETPVVTPETLEPQTVIDVPEVPQANQLGTIADQAVTGAEDAFTQQQAAAAQAAEGAKTTALQDYLESIRSSKGIAGLTAEVSDELNIQGIESELNTVNDQIRKEQLALRRATERIQESGGGLASGAAAEISNLQRESFAKQADLSLIQLAAQGKYDSAKAAVDRVVDAKLEQQKIYNDTLGLIYQDAKDTFTTAEQREFETLLGNRNRALQEEKEKQTAIYDLALQAQLDGAPTDVVQAMMAADSRDKAMAVGGSYIGRLDRQAKNASIRASNANASLAEQKLLDVQAKQEQLDAAIASGQVVLDADQADRAASIAKNFEGEAADFKSQVSAYNRIIASAEDPSAAGDVAVVFNFMKMLDPGSVVRESEFALAANTGSLNEAIKNKFGKVATGEILNFTRDDFVDRAQRIYESSLDQQIELENRYRTQATDLFGLPENAADLIVQDIRATGAVSDTAFELQLNQLSPEQQGLLIEQGLLQ